MKRKQKSAGNSEFKIEHNVKMPPQRGGPGRELKYPWADMKIGDSVLIPDARPGFNPAHKYAHNHPPMKFATRKVEGGIRVWRIK